VTSTPEAPRRKRQARTADVVRVSNLTPHMIRVVLGGPGLDGFEVGGFTDHYVKLLFPPPGASYAHPFDVDDIQASHPRDQWPVTRTYTVRRWDAERGELTLDFVYHGDEGVAGPWAATAKPGDSISFFGPGGGYAPDPDAAWHLLVGDESALPAIATALERLPTRAVAVVIIEVEDESEHQELSTHAEASITWVHRADDTRGPGVALIEAVQSAQFPDGEAHAFVHGDAGAIRDIRRYLRSELGLEPAAMSVSGYWRRGRTDEAWRAEKADWKREIERDDEQLSARAG
jgi:NADPH-dependent ferric siderophore reductase